jgi:hypothetical protein
LAIAAVALPRLDFQNKTGVWLATVTPKQIAGIVLGLVSILTDLIK